MSRPNHTIHPIPYSRQTPKTLFTAWVRAVVPFMLLCFRLTILTLGFLLGFRFWLNYSNPITKSHKPLLKSQQLYLSKHQKAV